MENKKTIEYLNSKAWYRALKVMYLIFTIICYLVSIGAIGGYTFHVYDQRNQYNKQEVRRVAIQNGIIPAPKYSGRITPFEDWLNSEALNHPKPKPNTTLWILGLLLWIPLCLFCAWFIAKVPKWIFYYIALGTIKPNNN